LDILQVEERGFGFIDSNFALKAGHKINEAKAVFPRLESK
jgi:hypothetical protein